MQDAQQGLSDEALAWADVLVYFSHKHWREIPDERVDALQRRVLDTGTPEAVFSSPAFEETFRAAEAKK